MQDKLTPRQVRAWSLCALSVPAAMALPGCGWLWVLGGSILACALAACQQAMQRHSGLCMRQAFARAFGAVGGRIMAAAEDLGYSRKELARAIVTGRNNVVAVIVSGDPDLEFTQRIISGALDAASEQNFSVKLFQPRPEEMETTLRKLLEQQIAGVLLHDASIRILEPWLKKLKKLGIPCGVFNLQNPTGIGFGIYSDDHAGMESAVEYLAGLGHRRIAHLTTKDQPFGYVELRRSGYLDGMAKYSPEKPRILEGISWGFDSNLELLFALLEEPAETRPTAVACSTDFLAAELYHAAYLRKKFIPEEFSVVG